MPDAPPTEATPVLPDGPLVSAPWLRDHLRDVRLVDVRYYLDGRSGQAAYTAGHLPGAVWVDLDNELSDPPGAGRHPLPSPERFAAALGRLGIGATTPVVAYDDAGGSIAARLWWLLTLLDHPVAVLDGGMAAWDGPLETVAVHPTPTQVAPRAFPAERLVDADALALLAGAGQAVVLDARSAERFARGDLAIDPRRGHVPGARSAPWVANLDDHGRFLPAHALAARYAALGVDDATVVIAYCGSGVTACHDLLALDRAGLGATRLYPGSWSDWGADPTRPAEIGPGHRAARAPPGRPDQAVVHRPRAPRVTA